MLTFTPAMPMAQLVTLYNTFADHPVKKFTDKATALRRLEALSAQLRAARSAEVTAKLTIGRFVLDQLAAGLSAASVAAALCATFPHKAAGRDYPTAKKHVAWYACKAKINH